jgi:hypothetical protein
VAGLSHRDLRNAFEFVHASSSGHGSEPFPQPTVASVAPFGKVPVVGKPLRVGSSDVPSALARMVTVRYVDQFTIRNLQSIAATP